MKSGGEPTPVPSPSRRTHRAEPGRQTLGCGSARPHPERREAPTGKRGEGRHYTITMCLKVASVVPLMGVTLAAAEHESGSWLEGFRTNVTIRYVKLVVME
jgi:hypothetical protein